MSDYFRLQETEQLRVRRLNDLATKVGRSAEMVAAPATATSPGVPGQWAQDGSYLYICTAVDTWRRVAIATW